MTNVLGFAERGESLKRETAYKDGQQAAKDFYLADLQRRMTGAWLDGDSFVVASYDCPPEDPLYRKAVLKDYQRGIEAVLKAEFKLSIFVEGPQHSHFLRLAVSRPGVVTWFLRVTMWLQDRKDARQARQAARPA